MNHPRSDFAAPPRGGAAAGPAKPDSRRLLGLRRPLPRGWPVRSLGLLRALAAALAARRRRARADRDLGSLDAYMLRDVGLSHRDAARGILAERTQ